VRNNSEISSKKGYEKVILDSEGNPCFRRVVDDYGKQTIDVPVTEKGFVKELEVQLIQKREYFSERTFENKVAIFLLTYKLKMPKDRALQYVYFYYEHGFSNVCIRNFDTGLTTSINIMNENNQKEYGIRQISRKRISITKANSLIRDKAVLPDIYGDNGEIGQTTAY
jgi:hypothetical protein